MANFGDSMFADSAILVTGGTGSFGKALIGRLLSLDTPPRRIVIFSRDELKQYEMSCQKPFSDSESLRYFWETFAIGIGSIVRSRESIS